MMNADDGMSKSSRVPTFDGQQANFMSWWMRFEAYAELQGFSDAIEPGGEQGLPKRSKVLDPPTMQTSH